MHRRLNPVGRHHWHVQVLQEQLVAADTKLRRGVEQIESGQAQLPSQLVQTTDRLQALVDSMQQDAAGNQARSPSCACA